MSYFGYDSCLVCEVKFDDKVNYHAKGMCSKCYQAKNWREKRAYNQRVVVTKCSECGLSKGDRNHKNKLIEKFITGLCRYCYNKRKKERTCYQCITCGVTFDKGSLMCYCPTCLPRKRHDDREISKKDLTPENLSEMLTLFRRFKNGTQTKVDHFRVVNLYLDILESKSFVYNSAVVFDGYGEESQVILMLRILKKIYDTP